MSLKLFYTEFRSHILKLIYIFGHGLIVNSRCYIKKIIPLRTFLKFHTHLKENSARSQIFYFQEIEFFMSVAVF